MKRITETQIAHYRQHGYALIEDFLTEDELVRTHDELNVLLPGWLDYVRDPSGDKPPNWDEKPRSRRSTRFPFKGTQLNANTLHPDLKAFAAEMAGHDNLFMEQADLSYKCRGHYADTDQIMHMDYLNHTLAYPPREPAYWQTAYLLYYTDVTQAHGPTAVCSWEHYPEDIHWPVLVSRDERPELYANEIGSRLVSLPRVIVTGVTKPAQG